MFRKMFKMELQRAFRPFRFLMLTGLTVLLLLVSNWENVKKLLGHETVDSVGIMDQIQYILGMDAFKCVIVIILCALYTSSFCRDDNSRYLRMILSRVDVTTYIQSRFLANFCVMTAASAVAFWGYTVCMLPVYSLVGKQGIVFACYYTEIAENYPALYIFMVSWIFALTACACSSVGLLYSSYKANSFVSIAIGGLVFYVALSYIPQDSVFSVLHLVGMQGVLGKDMPKWVTFLWSNFYMLSVIGICGLLFYRRMKWRVENGYV